jgi:glycogen debranching enzyme
VGELAQRLIGSPDIFSRDGRTAAASVNFVTAHDGFTIRDLVTYNVKHNGANGESNRDGSDDNRSWNCGFEGETENEWVIALRHRQVQNLMATLILASGVPMITAGDELGRTQQGNNNAYCQDSPISWVHWDTQSTWSDQTDLTRKLLQLRTERPVFRRHGFRHGEFLLDPKGEPCGRRNIAWFGGRNAEMTEQDWRDETRRTLGMYVAYDDPYRTSDEAFLIWFHGGSDAIQVELPDGPWADTYTVIAHTGQDDELPSEKIAAGSTLQLPGHTVVVLQVD